MSPARVSFSADDGFVLIGSLWKNPSTSKPSLILVHQFNRDRHTFDALAQDAFSRGYTVLSFDVRGFGESVMKNNTHVAFTSFTEKDYQHIARDILSAQKFLQVEHVAVVGASIGANAALNFGVLSPSAAGLVLLSPGENFKGIDTFSAAQKNTVPFLVVSSAEDQYSNESSQHIFDLSPLSDKKLLSLENAGHGTDMLLRNASLSKKIVDWLDNHP